MNGETTLAQPDPFQRAHADAQKAVALFLPSLSPKPAAPPVAPPPPGPLTDAVAAMSKARHVEKITKRLARHLPPEEEKRTPEKQFGNQLDVVHTRALSAAIAAHPEEERGRLILEAHDSMVKWIASHNGKVYVDGKVELAHGAQQAEKLAQKIVNETVKEHDARQAEQNAAPVDDNRSDTTAGGTPSPMGRPGPEIVPPAGKPAPEAQGPPPPVKPAEVAKVGARKPDGHQITQPKNSIPANQKLAMAAAPELEQSLSKLTAKVPGTTFARLRPQKDEGRLDQKVSDSNAPDTLSDYLGAQVAADSPEAKDALVALLQRHFKVIEVDDNFLHGREDKAGYPSANVQVQLGTGSTAEIQIVPREVQEATDQSHVFYKAGRDAEERGDTAERDRQWAQAKAIHDAQLGKFKQRNLQDTHAPLRQSLDAAGLKPIKLGGRLFYALNPGVESANAHAPQAAQSQPPRESGKSDGTTADVSRSGDGVVSTGEVHRPALKKGDQITLKETGEKGQIVYLHPNLNIARVRVDGKIREVNPSSDLQG